MLAPEPDILLLDEPTNHLDLPAIEWLENELKSLRSALVLVSHDRRFLTNLSRATVWLDRGRTRRIEQGFGAFEDWRDQVLEEEERERHKLDRKIAARGGLGPLRRHRRGASATCAAWPSSATCAARSARPSARVGVATMTVSEGRTSGKLVIEAEGISKSYGDRPIVRDFSTRVLRGDRLGIVGANGAGKTTLLNLLTGRDTPDAGTVKLGANVAARDARPGRARASSPTRRSPTR